MGEKKEPTEWEKIFSNDISEKGLISKNIYKKKKLIQHHKKDPIKTWAEGLNRHISKTH